MAIQIKSSWIKLSQRRIYWIKIWSSCIPCPATTPTVSLTSKTTTMKMSTTWVNMRISMAVSPKRFRAQMPPIKLDKKSRQCLPQSSSSEAQHPDYLGLLSTLFFHASRLLQSQMYLALPKMNQRLISKKISFNSPGSINSSTKLRRRRAQPAPPGSNNLMMRQIRRKAQSNKLFSSGQSSAHS